VTQTATPTLPADAWATAFGESPDTSTNRCLFSASRSTWTIFGGSSTGVADTNSVASARPYDGLIASGLNPYSANASLNLRTVAAEIGSLPLSTAFTLDRSSGGSPSLGRPRAAAWSKAKFGATEMTPPVSPSLRA